jgi:hypothetical protein
MIIDLFVDALYIQIECIDELNFFLARIIKWEPRHICW